MTTMGLPQLGVAIKGRSLVLKVPAGLSSGSPVGPGDAVVGGFVVESARAMPTNEVLQLSGTQCLGPGLIAKRNGSD